MPRFGMGPAAREPLTVAGLEWEVYLDVPQFGQFQAAAQLPDAYVTIFAPDRATFERVAASLQRLP
jgi:hypothetical protein